MFSCLQGGKDEKELERPGIRIDEGGLLFTDILLIERTRDRRKRTKGGTYDY
jgi:hypothetical protein